MNESDLRLQPYLSDEGRISDFIVSDTSIQFTATKENNAPIHEEEMQLTVKDSEAFTDTDQIEVEVDAKKITVKPQSAGEEITAQVTQPSTPNEQATLSESSSARGEVEE